MSEPYREWWIHSTGNAYTQDVSSNFPVVHVIEYAAYAELKAELALLKQAARPLVNERLITVTKERDELLAQAEKLAEALEWYSECALLAVNDYRFDGPVIMKDGKPIAGIDIPRHANEALKEWNEWKDAK